MPTEKTRWEKRGFGLPWRPGFLSRDKYWVWIHQQAESTNQFERVGAMANAVGALELALTASGLNPKRRKAISTTEYPGWPESNELEDAYLIRHRAVHGLKVPAPEECKKHVATFYQAWLALRRRFVTIENAARLANEFLRSRHISEVFLFGSLPRRSPYRSLPEPGDIDLLIVDDGTLSWRWSRYGKVLVDSLLESAELSTKANRAAERSEWLDLVPVHGKLFGINRAYTATVFRHQTDPFFFINVADGLLAFDQPSGKWVNNPPLIFRHLAHLRKQLRHMSLVRPQLGDSDNSSTYEGAPLPPFSFDERFVDFDDLLFLQR